MQRLLVVGGGISGLAAAWSARAAASERDLPLEILVCERAGDVGGKARTVDARPWRVETGPTGFLDNEPVLDSLVAASGLEKLAADGAAARRFLVLGERLREIRPHPLKFATSGILSPLGLARLACEPWIAPRTDAQQAGAADESVWDFARRRLGRQAADRLIAPMVLGVFAGDAKRLSLRSAFPRMAELERDHGGLFRALRALRRTGKSRGGPAGPGATLTSFQDGLQSFARALAARGEFDVRTGAAIARIDAAGGGGPRFRARIAGDGESLPIDALVVATEPWAAATMLEPVVPEGARELARIACPPVAVVALGYGAEALARVPRGFGALIPRSEPFRILGVLWDTHLFGGRSAEGTLLVRTMLGGATDPEIGGLGDEELARLARTDVARLFGLRDAPTFEHVTLWPRAIPQYELGHAERIATIARALERRPGLHLAGNATDGVAFGKAAALGWRRGREAVEELAARDA